MDNHTAHPHHVEKATCDSEIESSADLHTFKFTTFVSSN